MNEVGESYVVTRQRLRDMLGTLDEDEWALPVDACPGWQVRDVVAHLTAICEDALAGRLTGPPSEEVTAEQVERLRPVPPAELLRRWDELAQPFAELADSFSVWAPVFDVWAHEQDIRTAVGRPGGRDHPLVDRMTELIMDGIDIDGQLVVEGDTRTYRSPDKPGPEYKVRTTPFEMLRLRVGRRSPDQVEALDWSTDPSPILDDLFMFGPRTQALVE
jgi:uncharacterized protein (TIGR03083 family)